MKTQYAGGILLHMERDDSNSAWCLLVNADLICHSQNTDSILNGKKAIRCR